MLYNVIMLTLVSVLSGGFLLFERLVKQLITNEEKIMCLSDKYLKIKFVKYFVDFRLKQFYSAVKTNDFKWYRILLDFLPNLIILLTSSYFAINNTQDILEILLSTIIVMWVSRIVISYIFITAISISSTVLSNWDKISDKKSTHWFSKLIAIGFLGYCIVNNVELFLILAIFLSMVSIISFLLIFVIKETIIKERKIS